jgi:2-(1,2-epoxy-1,2-dihydrophenyl)acetyl-CoA isomerase
MTATPTGTVNATQDGAVTILTLSYPERRNALSLPLRAALTDELSKAMDDERCRVIVLTGEGGHFCSGGDISSFDGVTPVAGRQRLQRLHPAVRMLIGGEKPVIAAVEGYAAGAGLSLAAACDIVVASQEAKFSCPFNKIGLFPDLGAAWTLPLRMGQGRARMMMMSGRTLDALEAERQGLVEQVCAPGTALAEAIELAKAIAETAPLTNGLLKAALSRGPGSLEAVLAAEADAQGLLYSTEDFQEGRLAFLEKRAPNFRGR